MNGKGLRTYKFTFFLPLHTFKTIPLFNLPYFSSSVWRSARSELYRERLILKTL